MCGYRNESFVTKMEETAVQETASGLENVNKLIRLLSGYHHQPFSSNVPDLNVDCNAVADAAVSKFKRVISLLGRTRTGHARLRRGPLVRHPSPELNATNKRVYYATPIQQVNPPLLYSCSAGGGSFMLLSLTGDNATTTTMTFDRVSSAASAPFQMESLSSAGKPPLSSTSSMKRKCSSETFGSCPFFGRCHCSKKRKSRLKRVTTFGR